MDLEEIFKRKSSINDHEKTYNQVMLQDLYNSQLFEIPHDLPSIDLKSHIQNKAQLYFLFNWSISTNEMTDVNERKNISMTMNCSMMSSRCFVIFT